MFNKTRLKLTAWYLLIIMFVSISFSAVIYEGIIGEVERFARIQRLRIERGFYDENIRPAFEPVSLIDLDLVKEAKQRTLLMLVMINGTIFFASGGLGYFLAGKTLEPIKEMVEEQNRFVSDASHELRTPLTSLKTAMEVSLRDRNLSLKNAKTLISESIGEVNKLQSLSDELLQLTQYHKPNGTLKFETVSLAQISKEAIRKIMPLAKRKQISIKNETENIKIEASKHGIIDLLVIFLDNAVKYSPKTTSITLSSKKTDGSVIISVTDQGIGIGEKDAVHIFDRFYRADSARSKRNADGYGLGLSIAKKIVDIHHGSINVESKLKQGTTFAVQLPKNQPANVMKPPFFS